MRYLLFYLAIAGVLAATVFPLAGTLGVDCYFHHTVARQMVQQGAWYLDIGWLPLTVLGKQGPDHHWLWHLLIVPFAAFADPLVGLKLAAVATAAAVPTSLLAVMRALRVPGPWPYLFALLATVGASVMPGRLLMLRAQNLAIIFIAAILWALVRRRPVWVGVLTFLFMQAYHAAVIVAALALLAFVGWLACRRVLTHRLLLAAAAGGLAAVLINPWFPSNIDYLLFHVLFKVTNASRLAVGLEWASPPLSHLLAESWPVIAALVVSGATAGLVAWRRRGQHRSAFPVGLVIWFGVTLLCLVLYKLHWRFVEYFVPVAAVTSGLLTRQALILARPRRRIRLAALAAATLLVLASGWIGLDTVRRYSVETPDRFQQVGVALQRGAAAGDMVFNSAWSDFPFLLWYAPQARYVTGLDPNYLEFEHPRLSGMWRWLKQVRPTEPTDPALLIRQHFKARWAVVNIRDRGLLVRLTRSPRAKVVARSSAGVLFEL